MIEHDANGLPVSLVVWPLPPAAVDTTVECALCGRLVTLKSTVPMLWSEGRKCSGCVNVMKLRRLARR